MSIPTNQVASETVSKMMHGDLFSQWLGIEVMETKEGYCKLQIPLRKEMVNGFGIIHGGITFSLADSAFAFACNSRNNLSVALDVTITYTKAA
ncbi:MAG TPA: hotdog fold thioesterase, partial [Flavisolibacter sp.]|nr:hotdog fold thioesterase [Flavisolibacter sp.]